MRWLLLLVTLVACHTYGPVLPPMPTTPTDTNCAGACEHLRVLGCEEGAPLPDGTTCEQFCKETQKQGHALRPSCVMKLKSCSPMAMEECQGPVTFLGD